LLEDPERIAIAVVEVSDAGLLSGCGQGNDGGVGLVGSWREGAYGCDNLFRDRDLFGVRFLVAQDGCESRVRSRAAGVWRSGGLSADEGQDQDRYGERDEQNG